MTRTALLCAGGTGGHLFPAMALAQELKARGWRIHLATDPRARRFAADFPADGLHIVESATFKGRNPVALLRTVGRLGMGYAHSRGLLRRLKPNVVVGFGGYPTVPPLLAATHMRIPTVLHEQNAVMGRANRALVRFADLLRMGAIMSKARPFVTLPDWHPGALTDSDGLRARFAPPPEQLSLFG